MTAVIGLPSLINKTAIKEAPKDKRYKFVSSEAYSLFQIPHCLLMIIKLLCESCNKKHMRIRWKKYLSKNE